MVVKNAAVSVVLGAIFSLGHIGGAQAAVSYAPPVSTAVATPTPAPEADNPEFIAKGDLDGVGGVNDLVTVNETDRTVTVLLRNGAGVLTSNASYAVRNSPRQVAIGDLNGDTYNDLVVPNPVSGDVTVYLNNNDGTFTEALESPIALGGEPTAPVIADFNGGVGLDIAITDATTNSVHILFGDGDGTFTPGTSLTVGLRPTSMTAGNLDNALGTDLVVANYDDGAVIDAGTVSVFLGDGAGGFTLSQRLTTGGRPWSVKIGSIDTLNDAIPDLVLANYNINTTVRVYKGVGDGTFNTAVLSQTNVQANKPHSVEVADLDNDTYVDVVVANDDELASPATADTTGVTVLLGDGTGAFPTVTHYPVSGQPNGVVSLHLDNTDPLLDLAVANGTTGKVDVLLSVPTTTAPVASDDTLAVTEDTATTGTLVAADADGALLNYSIVANGTLGTAVITDDATGAYTYTPTANVSGEDTFTFKANDGTADSNTSTITVTIAAVNDAPTISGTPATKVGLNTAYSFTPGGGDVDVGDTLTYSIINKPTWASFSTTTGALTGTPTIANVGTTTGIVISVSDGIAAPVSLAAFDLRVVSVVNVTASDAAATEAGRTTGRFTFTRTGSTAAALTVNYIVGGTATAGRDYLSLGGRITFPIGVRTVTRIVKPLDDTLQELKETVILSLSQSPNYAVGSARRAAVILTSNETVTRTVTVAATDATATEAGRTTGRFTFTRTGSTAAALTVNYIVRGTATAGGDYVSLGTRVTFPIGASTVIRTVTPINDTLQESNETVILNLWQSPNYAVRSTASSATVTVTSND